MCHSERYDYSSSSGTLGGYECMSHSERYDVRHCKSEGNKQFSKLRMIFCIAASRGVGYSMTLASRRGVGPAYTIIIMDQGTTSPQFLGSMVATDA